MSEEDVTQLGESLGTYTPGEVAAGGGAYFTPQEDWLQQQSGESEPAEEEPRASWEGSEGEGRSSNATPEDWVQHQHDVAERNSSWEADADCSTNATLQEEGQEPKPDATADEGEGSVAGEAGEQSAEASQKKPQRHTPSKGRQSASSYQSTQSYQSARSSWLEFPRPADVTYKRKAPIIQNPLLPSGPCYAAPKHMRMAPRVSLDVKPGPDRSGLAGERQHFRHYKTACSAPPFPVNSAIATPMRPRPYKRSNTPGSKAVKSSKAEYCGKWAELEENLKNYRDHLLAEEIGYETLVGNLLYIDIPGGRDINRSWENFLSEDPMEWGFPYYKGSRERPRVKQREPYLAHQLKEKLWKYPKTRIFHSTPDE